MRKHIIPSLIFLSAGLAIALPTLFTSGQIFLLDFVMHPQFAIGDLARFSQSASLPSWILLWLVGTVSSVAIAQKIFLLVVLLLPMFAMYHLLSPITRRPYAVLGGLLFLLNPFMYERFVAGHWFVMLGLSYLPIVFYYLRRCLNEYSYRNTAYFSLAFAVYPLVSLHFAYIGMGLVVAYIFAHMVWRGGRHIMSEKYLRHGGIFLALFIIVNSFWLPSFLAPDGTFRSIDQRDFGTFITQGDGTIGVFLNVLTLHGFWREVAILPKYILPLWWIPSLIIFCFAIVGVIARYKQGDRLAKITVLFSPIVLLLAVGYATSWTETLTRFVSSIVPGFTGLRETAKLVGVFAFSYAYFAPLGLQVSLEHFFGKARKVVVLGALFISICGLATAFPMLWGATGQIKQAEYPASWRIVDTMLSSDSVHGKVLVFPWRGYLEIDWLDGEFIANPAPVYFSVPVETAQSINNVMYDEKYTTQFDESIPLDKSSEEIARNIDTLRAEGVEYVILLKTSDWERYVPVLSDPAYFTQLNDGAEVGLFKLVNK